MKIQISDMRVDEQWISIDFGSIFTLQVKRSLLKEVYLKLFKDYMDRDFEPRRRNARRSRKKIS